MSSREETIRQLLSDADPDQRLKGVAALVQAGSASVIARLAEALHDDDDAVRLAAVDGLARLGDVHAIGHLLAMLDRHDDELWHDRPAVIRALSRFPSNEVLDALIKVLRDANGEEDEDTEAAAAWALGQTSSARSVKELEEVVHGRRHHLGTKLAAISSLERLMARDSLIRLAVASDVQPAMRELAAAAVGRVGEPQDAIPLRAAIRALPRLPVHLGLRSILDESAAALEARAEH